MRPFLAAIALSLTAFLAHPAAAQQAIATTSAGEVVIATPDTGPATLQIGGTPVAVPGKPWRVFLDQQVGDDLLFLLGDPEEGWCRMLYAWVHAGPDGIRPSPLFGTCAEAGRVDLAPDGSLRVVMAVAEPGAGDVAYDWTGTELRETALGLPNSGQGAAGPDFWLGRYPYDLAIAADYQDRLEALLGAPLVAVLRVNLSLSTPFEAEGGWIVGRGCEKSACDDEAALLAISAADGHLLVGLRQAGESALYGGRAGEALPAALQAFLAGE